jgi:hypothetical protein
MDFITILLTLKQTKEETGSQESTIGCHNTFAANWQIESNIEQQDIPCKVVTTPQSDSIVGSIKLGPTAYPSQYRMGITQNSQYL